MSGRQAGSHRSRSAFRVQGRFFVCVILAAVLYFIAGSIGSGFMFLLSSTMVAAAMVGFIYPWFALRIVDVIARAPASATANEALQMSVVMQPRLQNRVFAGLMPQQMLVCHFFDRDERASKSYEALVEEFADGKATVRIAHPAGLPRGVHRLGVAISSAFPLGLVFWERQVMSADDTVVYPVTYPMEGLFLYRLPSLGSGAFGFPREGVCRQSTFTRSLRRYVRGDSPRSIHWPSTARAGKLMVREFDAEGMPYFDLVLDLTANWTSQAQFELAISTAASLISLGQKMGISPDLRLIPPLPELNLKLPASLPGYEMQMEILARVQPRGSGDGTAKASPERNATGGVEAHNYSPDERTFKRSGERTPIIICPPGYQNHRAHEFLMEIVDTLEKEQTGASAINKLTIESTSELQAI
jgi:Protein of unknown function DUF58